MALYERLDKDGNQTEIRDFPEGWQRPVDIPHKGIIWRQFTPPAPPEPNPETLQKNAIARHMREVRINIIDALPDMEAVAKIRQASNEHIEAIKAGKIKDVADK